MRPCSTPLNGTVDEAVAFVLDRRRGASRPLNAIAGSEEMRAGEVITAEVVRIDQNFVVVNAGLKSESTSTSRNSATTAANSTKSATSSTVAIDALEDGYGDPPVARQAPSASPPGTTSRRRWIRRHPGQGRSPASVKGGLTVMTNGIRAFLPGSLVDMRRSRTPRRTKARYEFKVIKLDRKRNNVVVRARAVLEESMGEGARKLLDEPQEGTVVKGVVKNITDYGAFVDLGGIDGLLHITDLAWRRVRHPSEVLSVGDEVTAKVPQVRPGKEPRLARPQAARRRSVGRHRAVTRRAPACSARSPTSPTTAPSSRSSPASRAWSTSPRWTGPTRTSTRKVVQLGDEVEVMILEIDEDRRRISLGMKQCMRQPVGRVRHEPQEGRQGPGQIKSITDFGVFIGPEGGIDGLVHLSDLSWSESGEDAVRRFKKGDEVEAVVLAIDVERERISLGIKQLVAGDDVEGYLRASEAAPQPCRRPHHHVQGRGRGRGAGDQRGSQDPLISLSIRAKDQVEQSEAMSKLASESSTWAGTTNLGPAQGAS